MALEFAILSIPQAKLDLETMVELQTLVMFLRHRNPWTLPNSKDKKLETLDKGTPQLS